MAIRKGLIAALAGVAIGAIAPFVASWEGTKRVAYQDGGGVWTICTGHTKGVKAGDAATAAQCRKWLEEDLSEAADAVASCVNFPMPSNQWMAWTSFTFNVGRSAFCRSTAARKINQGDLEGACNELPRWVYVGDKDCRIEGNNCFGLVKRRMAEYNLCWPNFSNVIGG